MNLANKIFNILSEKDFENLALQIFQYQYKEVKVYQQFCNLLKVNPTNVNSLNKIPFLPIQFFKSHQIIADNKKHKVVFSSSGTTGTILSKHYVHDLQLYKTGFTKTFNSFIKSSKELTILALLPNYLEREGSSLVFMVNQLIKQSNNINSGFYLKDLSSLIQKIEYLENNNRKTLLVGVSYALLDLIEIKKFKLKNTIIMETGGMKGRRKEMIKKELHKTLKDGFGVSSIYSEYGMTELLSQAYSYGDGLFNCPPWMRVITRDTEEAQSLILNKTGGINIIDLANIYSCSFIATQDLGKVNEDGSFEIMGRFDDSDIRGCNLMIQ